LAETSLSDLLGPIIGVAAATSLVHVAAQGFVLHRQRTPNATYFALAVLGLAWAVLTTSLSLSKPLVEAAPVLDILSPLCSGYAPAALLLFVERCLRPEPRLGPGWLLLGSPGTAYTWKCWIDPHAHAFVRAYRAHTGPDWDASVSPYYFVHVCAQTTAMLWTLGLLGAALAATPPGRYRRSLWWLLGVFAIGLVVVLTYSVLPGALGWPWAIRAGPLLSIPSALFALRSLHWQAVEAQAGWVPTADAEAQRHESIRDLLRGVSDAIGRVVTELSSQLTRLDPASPVEWPGHLARARALVADADALVAQLDRATGWRPATPQAMALVPRLHRWRAEAPEGVDWSIDPNANRCWTRADPDTLDAAMSALIANALDANAARGGGAVSVSVTLEQPCVVPSNAHGAPLDGANAVRIDVLDRGDGMTAETESRCFDPFFSTRSGHRGLGLVSVRAAYTEAGGAFVHETGPRGTRATLWLPLATPPARPAAPPLPAWPQALPAWIYVDADPVRLELFSALVATRRAPFRAFATADDAARWLDDAPRDAAFLLCVQAGPGSVDLSLARRCLDQWPAARVAVIVDPGTRVPLHRHADRWMVYVRPIRPRELVALLQTPPSGAAGPG